MDIEVYLKEAVRKIIDNFNPEKIILFGSYARNEADEGSDIDFLIVEKTVKDRVAEMVRLNRILSPLRIPVDLLVVSEEMFDYWSSTPGSVYYNALTEGKTIYEAT